MKSHKRKKILGAKPVQKFLVASYDSDEQQWFYDVVFAETSDKAGERIVNLRPYVIGVDVTSFSELVAMITRIRNRTQIESEEYLTKLETEKNEN